MLSGHNIFIALLWQNLHQAIHHLFPLLLTNLTLFRQLFPSLHQQAIPTNKIPPSATLAVYLNSLDVFPPATRAQIVFAQPSSNTFGMVLMTTHQLCCSIELKANTTWVIYCLQRSIAPCPFRPLDQILIFVEFCLSLPVVSMFILSIALNFLYFQFAAYFAKERNTENT